MSKLIDYLNKIEKDVEQWPSWKNKSLKEAFKIPSFQNPNQTLNQYYFTQTYKDLKAPLYY